MQLGFVHCGYSQDKTVVEFGRQLHNYFSGNLLNRLDKRLAAIHGGNTGDLFLYFFQDSRKNSTYHEAITLQNL